MNINQNLIVKTIKFCFDCVESNSYFVWMLNSIFVENNFDVFTRVFENLKSFSTSMTNFFVAEFVFIKFIDFDFIAFFANHVSFIIFRFQSLQNRAIVNVRCDYDEIKKKIHILEFDSSSFLTKKNSKNQFRKIIAWFVR